MPTPLTYQQLLQEQDRKVQLSGLNEQTAANRATALRNFLRANTLHVEDVVGNEMRIQYPDALETFLETLRTQGRSPRSITNTKAAMRPWKEAVVEFDTLQALAAEKPTPFIESLLSLIGDRPVTRVAQQAGIPKDMLLGWLRGKIPRCSNVTYVLRLEGFFGAESNLLVQLSGMKVKGERQESIGGTPAPIEYRNDLGELTRIIYAVKPRIDSPLRQQWTEFLRYKTMAVPLYKRAKRGRWRVSPCPLTAMTQTNWWAFLDGREVASARMGWQFTSTFLGWLKMSTEVGGKGLREAQVQTMAWLAVPDHLEEFLNWRADRARKRNQGFMQFLAFVASIVRPRTGYLLQRPELQQSLPRELRKERWDTLCARQFELVEQLTGAYYNEIEVSRDSFEPIKHILDYAAPMDAMADMIQRLRADRPLGNRRREAIWSRNLVLLKILLSNPLRKRNLAHLTWRADNTGHVYQRVDGSWWIKIPKNEFKNSYGAAGDIAYDSPIHATAWPDIERYIHRHRPALMVAPTDLVFLTMKEKGAEPTHRPWVELGQTVATLTAKYLVRCRGIGPHAFRHIVASSILKADGGDFKTAALVLNDRIQTVERHYASLRSGDGAVRMAELLDSSFRRM